MSDAMNSIGCNRLDDFLDHDLRGADRQEFVEHIETCVSCRAAVSVHQSLCQRLRIGIEGIESTPRELATRIDRRIRTGRFRRLALTALAASLAFAAVWLVFDRPPQMRFAPPPLVVQNPPAQESPVRIRFPNRDVIVMPVASESPNVTVVMVYPELQAAVPAPLERNER